MGYESERGSPAWRSAALAPVFSKLSAPPSASASLFHSWDDERPVPRVPSLAHLCVRYLHGFFADSPDAFNEDVLPFLATHLRRDMIRDSAIRSPSNTQRLNAMYAGSGHADGEILVVGPQAALKAEWIGTTDAAATLAAQASSMTISDSTRVSDDWEAEDADWEEDTKDAYTLHTLLLLSTRLSPSLLPQLPATLTILALMDIPNAVAVHRLPRLCPRLTVLDLSFNQAWLDLKLLSRVDWRRWRDLQLLGLRDCNVSLGDLKQVNEGRWSDVEIII
jgi:hypothetical protein